MFALVPPQVFGEDVARASPLSNSSGLGGGSRSCPTTPRPERRRYLKEGFCQLTSIESLSHHHRYMFLFDDLLLVCKQKGENSYKLKEKVALEWLWLCSNNCTNSFLLGWPTTRNYIAHFSSERDKSDWFDKLNAAIQRRLRPKTTTIGLYVQIEGRQQLIRQEVRNGQKSDQFIEELCRQLHLPALDPHLGHYQLCFCPGTTPKRGRNPSGFQLAPSESFSPFSGGLKSTTASAAASPAQLRRVHSHTSIVAPLQSQQHQQQQHSPVHPLHGVENVYAVLMEFVRNQLGISLSDSQLAHLDTCPLVNCRLLLRQSGPNGQQQGQGKSGPFSLVSQFRRVLGRAESAASGAAAAKASSSPLEGHGQQQRGQKRLFGRQLRGSMPPQPVLTMVDHLLLYGADAEGIFRKSPKQQTVRVLRQQLDQGQVPDFHQFSVHVTASLLKDYLRSIPGQLLLSGNYRLWTDAVAGEQLAKEKRVQRCRKLLALLPPAHTVLLRSLLRLLRKVAANEPQTKMGASALAVCIAPSLLEKLEQVESVRVVPELVMFLVENAPALFDGFLEEGALLPGTPLHPSLCASATANSSAQSPLHQSTDSGLSEVGAANSASNAMGSKRRFLGERRSISPDSGKLSSEPPSEDDAECRRSQGRMRWMKTHSLDDDELGTIGAIGPFGAAAHARYIDLDGDLAAGGEGEEEEERQDSEKTPVVLSRENSDVKDSNCVKTAAALESPRLGTWRSAQLHREQRAAGNGGGRVGAAKAPLARNLATAQSPHGSRKCSTASTNLDRNLSPTGSATPRKVSTVSTVSVDSAGSQGGNSGTAALSRRALLATKSEALGLVETDGSRKSSLMSSTGSNGNGTAQRPATAGRAAQTGQRQQLVGAKAQLQRAQPMPASARAHWSPQALAALERRGTASSVGSSAGSSACPSPSFSERSQLNVPSTRRFSAGTPSNSATVHGPGQTRPVNGGQNESPRRASSGLTNGNSNGICTFGVRQQQQKYVPPKRTAEELLLDKLEVNWSVPQIRKQFQQNAVNGHAPVIDTLYAKLPASPTAWPVGGPK